MQESLKAALLSLPKKDESDSQLPEVAALRPLKLLTQILELNLTPKAFGCEIGLTLEPKDMVDLTKNVVADVAAILHSVKQEEYQCLVCRIFDQIS